MARKMTEDALLEAIKKVLGGDSLVDRSAMTVSELANSLNFNQEKVRRLLLELKANGELEVVTVKRENLAGIFNRLPGYKLKDANATKNT